jgi:hypothetical protein
VALNDKQCHVVGVLDLGAACAMLAAQLPPDCPPVSKTHNPYPFKIAGVDMRSEHGRRFGDLAALVIAEHGPDLDPVKLRELAGLRLSVEITQAALVNGDPKARNDLVRLSSAIRLHRRSRVADLLPSRTTKSTAGLQAGLPEWPFSFSADEHDRLDGEGAKAYGRGRSRGLGRLCIYRGQRVEIHAR